MLTLIFSYLSNEERYYFERCSLRIYLEIYISKYFANKNNPRSLKF